MCKHQDWFDENNTEIQKLLDDKYQDHWAYQNDTSSQSKKDVYCSIWLKAQLHLRKLQDEWFSQKADKIKSYTDIHNWEQFYGALKAVYGPQSSGSSPMLSADGSNLLTDKEKNSWQMGWAIWQCAQSPFLHQWRGHSHLPKVVINSSIANSPTMEEVRRPVKALSTSKAPGSNAIPGKLYILSRLNLIYKLTEFCLDLWSCPTWFLRCHHCSSVYRKGNQKCCNSHWGISLLLTAGKVLAHLLLNCLLAHLEHGLLPESQCGFQEGCSIVDMVFAA